ncbi:NADPH-dependent FMN reductase [Allosaccharopolyspora coralli]|uniref:NADPH-dependent FMN reductase n=1 Tax=Allosaccharopolyspora coralli TaxID=2665642 RepID=A0A5Q3Q618_9PSEU|nr:NADPH-dependent FMN reductase [Allosaccharopolyspora coralli]QGK70038.1 NADPH-dependent FMN reductase [Allosaccharopolyspora coralli]
MSSIMLLSGSPSPTSRTAAVLDRLGAHFRSQDHEVHQVGVRDLPPEALLAAQAQHPRIAEATDLLAESDGLVIATPVYKAAYSGLLKAFLDLLPQYALAGKTILPLATGGSTAHVLAIDYALRPVLTSMGAAHVLPGYFLLDQAITRTEHGADLDPDTETPLMSVVAAFTDALRDRDRVGVR